MELSNKLRESHLGSHQIVHVVGDHPNFMKAAPVNVDPPRAAERSPNLSAPGQQASHRNMSDVFFEQLGIPGAECQLGSRVGHSCTQQTAEVMSRFEPVTSKKARYGARVDGDVNFYRGSRSCLLEALDNLSVM